MKFLRTKQSDSDLDQFRFRRGMELLSSVAGKIQPGSVWLDLGCNQGQFLQGVVRDQQVKGVGFDDWNADLKTPGKVDWQYFKADLDRELPWSEPADFISALEVLEHMIDTDGFLERIHRTLKPKGWVLISTPNINCLRNRITMPLGLYPTGLEYRNIIHHVRLYNAATLAAHLREHGFENVAMVGVSFLPLALAMGTGAVSETLANLLPSFCNNLIAVAQKP
jgi:2-polyprenyl-3-methyl-5-hydroxy-6-metoxy-1,4-benzoquinol methylase